VRVLKAGIHSTAFPIYGAAQLSGNPLDGTPSPLVPLYQPM